MKSVCFCCYFTFSFLFSFNASGQPGTLDETFGNGGKVMTNNGWQSVSGTTCLIQPDGKIVVGGSGYNGTLNYGWTLYRFQPNGSSDSSFAGDGCIDEGYIGDSGVRNIALQTDQKIIEFGYWGIKSVVKRWNADGTHDMSYGSNGEVLLDYGWNNMEILHDDRIILAGEAWVSQNWMPALVCLDTYGNLDQSYGEDGICIIPDTSLTTLYYSAMQSDDKIIVLGHNHDGNRFIISRIKTDGIIDSTFGLNGILTYQFWSGYLEPFAMITDPSDNIIISGAITATNDEDPFLMRLTPGGLLDSSFNENGFKTISYEDSTFDRWITIAFQKDEKIIVGGISGDSLLLCSFLHDGSSDVDFGNFGVVKDHFGGYWTFISGLCVQEDGKLVASGGNANDLMVIRYNTEFSIGLNDPKTEVVSCNIYPNPLQNQATLKYSLKTKSKVTISLLNIFGQTIDVFIDSKMKESGSHTESLFFNSGYSPGMYFVKMTCDNESALIRCEIY